MGLESRPPVKLTIIVPAFNEEAYLPSTLDSIQAAATHPRGRSDVETDIIVVDNNSEDETAAVAQSKGATVVHEPVQGIARARNVWCGPCGRGRRSSSSTRTWSCRTHCSTKSTRR